MKQKEFLRRLFGRNPGMVLSGLSSAYSEGDKKGFKNDFGCTIKRAEKIIEKFLTKLNK